MRNRKALWAVLWALLALGFLVGGGVLARAEDEVGTLSLLAVPAALVAALVSLSLARRARFDFQRSLGRLGGSGVAAAGRSLGLVALLLSLSGALAIGVSAILELLS